MGISTRDEAGETLVEILISLVIMSLVVAAIFTTYATVGSASKSQRDYVTADAEIRNIAEAVKTAAKSCTAAKAGQALTLPGPASPYPLVFSVVNAKCPLSVTTVQTVNITVTPPNGLTVQHLDVDVRTP